jgi:Zn-dependent peptidase ImmA (M78 family)
VIKKYEALRICEENFPNGPEALAKALNVKFVESPLQGVEGWCLRGKKVIIHINSLSPKSRQRFTLAHELSHLILGTTADFVIEPFRSDIQEERMADSLAAELLLPLNRIKILLGEIRPIDGKTLNRIAKKANVSQVMVACRITELYETMNLKGAAVIFFQNRKVLWRVDRKLSISLENSINLIKLAAEIKPKLVRIDLQDGTHAVATLIETNINQTLFVQALSSEIAVKLSYDERLGSFATQAFQADFGLIRSLNTTLGQFHKKNLGLSLDQMVQAFYKEYAGSKYISDQERMLKSTEGIGFVRLFLSRYFEAGH